MAALLAKNEAPLAVYERFALPQGAIVSTQRAARQAELAGDWLERLPCEPGAQALCLTLAASFPTGFPALAQALAGERARQNKVHPVTVTDLTDFLEREAKGSTIAQEMCWALPVMQAYAKV